MVKSREDLEVYFQRLGLRYESHEDGTFLVALAPGQSPVAVRLEPPVVVLEVSIGEAEAEDLGRQVRLLRRLLELNASDLLHASYGLQGSRIVLAAALEADNLDLNELEAALADMGMALSKHVPVLREMAEK
jgi:hypothetical protein